MNIGKNCCRLCLAPEEECVHIFNNFAADRERLDQKIFSCVHIKVAQEDRLSPKICHACISYLNSWQSFKNRCDAAEKKQKNWTESIRIESSNNSNTLLRNVKELCPGVTIESIPQKAQVSLEKQESFHTRKMHEERTEHSVSKQLDVEDFIKKEPKESEELNNERNVVMELDPTQFLIQSQNEDEENEMDYDDGDVSVRRMALHSSVDNGSSILASLGLHYAETAKSYANASDNENGDEEIESLHRQTLATCSVCDMTFSNRANARRHERNIHGLRQNPANPLSAQVPQSAIDHNESSVPNLLSNNTAIISTSTGIPSIDLKQKFKMKLKSQKEIYDYSNPSKYRYLITPNRLAFILRNREFLEQAQNMKCKCCNKSYPSYKYFMGHMRKKYQNLPRNVCFKCLRQFGSKGQFIGHLKRKSCINLYAIVMADDNIRKGESGVIDAIPGTKEVIYNKSYGCKICNKEFKPKMNLRQHVLEAHPEMHRGNETKEKTCAFCQQCFEDPVQRRKHYSSMDCIMFIVCCSCGERFETHISFVDHVYHNHLPSQHTGQDEYGYELFDQDGNSSSSHLRNPQNCPVCNKQYNNYYNVLRHMESKHPNQLPQIYQCTKCPEGFPRQSELRDHLHNAHGETALRQPKQQNYAHQLISSTDQNPVFTCKQCGQTQTQFYEWINHQSAEHSTFKCIKCEFQSDNREPFTIHCFTEHRNFEPANSKVQLYSCRQCANTYNSIDNLQEHLQTEHNLSSNDNKCLGSFNNSSESLNITEHPATECNEITKNNASNASDTLLRKTLNCGLCSFVLTDVEALRQHMSKMHGMDKKFFYCNQCSAKFMNDKGLKVHLFRVHGMRDESVPLTAGTSLLKPIQQNAGYQTQLLPVDEKDHVENDLKQNNGKECSICHTVYRSKDQLKLHMQSVHSESANVDSIEENTTPDSHTLLSINSSSPVLWFQCRYCSESFNTSKRLTIHMHTHEEYDKTDHSCKDCGGMYSSKKSLWVHRYKKHPKIPDASPCDICPRVFFDKTELFYHTSQAHVREVTNSETNGNGNVEEFGEMQSTSDALFSMLDTTTKIEASKITNQKAGDTVYQCDMCPKTFLILNALQVHRGWHFRSPDGRKVRDPKDIWQPDQLPPSKVKRMSQTHRTPSTGQLTISTPALNEKLSTCPYCYSAFSSEVNLKKHIVEVHKRVEAKNVVTPCISPSSSFVEKVKYCTPCSFTFDTVAEWINHKLKHVQDQKPSKNCSWCCDICNNVFAEKKQLLQHINSHLNILKTEENRSDDKDEQTNLSTLVKSISVDTKQQTLLVNDNNIDDNHSNDAIEEEIEIDEVDEDVDEGTTDDEQSDEDEQDKKTVEQYFCELCQVHFSSSNALRQHVSEHFVNGGLGSSILYTHQSQSHRTSTDSASSSNTSNSHNFYSNGNSSSDVSNSSANLKKELT